MAALQTSSLIFSSSSSKTIVNAAIHVPKLPKIRFTVPKTTPTTLPKQLDQELSFKEGFKNLNTTTTPYKSYEKSNSSTVTAQLYAILEAVDDRVVMHDNIGEQRENWNTLLLNSINMITLTATTMAGVAATCVPGMPILALKLSSALLFSAATGLSLVMNKLQPSQLTEEQRNAARLFRQLQRQLQTLLALRSPTEEDVKDAMEKVIALDRAYPLPLLGAMLEKFPEKYEPAVWLPSKKSQKVQRTSLAKRNNGWSEELEEEMREIIQVIKNKDLEDYERLGNIVLKVNKVLAISGPLLTGVAAISSTFVGNGAWWGVMAATTGALASAVNSFEHGGQVGMVFEMYRNCGGFFKHFEESIKTTIEERDLEKRENGELFETKVALKLGRSLSQLRDIAAKSASSRANGTAVDEFASKLF
ncbi:hypothetical protein UlMin_011251 [Ulmus minor]